MFLAALPQISLGTAALLIFALFLTYVLLRGIARLMVGTAMLAASALLAYVNWLKAPEISIAVFNKSVGVITTGLPIAVFVGSFIILRIALRWVANPFGSDKKQPAKDPRGLSKLRILSLLGFALIPTLMVLMIIAGILHHTASVHDLRQEIDPEGNPNPSYAQQLKSSVEAVLPENLINLIDPYARQSRINLAKLVSRQQKQSSLEPVTNLDTGKVIPRAIIVEDAELERLAREQKFGALLRHPALTRALENPQVRKLVDDLKP